VHFTQLNCFKMEAFASEEDVSGSETGNDSSTGGISVCQLNDKLKAIRPFSESQLMDLYSNEELERNAAFTDTFIRVINFL
jgi:hypothetical protein